jgi:hypothetical protein
MKRLLIILLALTLLVGSVAPAAAGSKARGRWEGLAIGLGAVSLYNLFSYGMFAPVVPPHTYGPYGPAPAVVYSPPVVYQQPAVIYQAPPVVCPPPVYYDNCNPGYYQDQGYYADPGYYRDYGPERVWVPGHRERHHRWTPGHWERD